MDLLQGPQNFFFKRGEGLPLLKGADPGGKGTVAPPMKLWGGKHRFVPLPNNFGDLEKNCHPNPNHGSTALPLLTGGL